MALARLQPVSPQFKALPTRRFRSSTSWREQVYLHGTAGTHQSAWAGKMTETRPRIYIDVSDAFVHSQEMQSVGELSWGWRRDWQRARGGGSRPVPRAQRFTPPCLAQRLLGRREIEPSTEPDVGRGVIRCCRARRLPGHSARARLREDCLVLAAHHPVVAPGLIRDRCSVHAHVSCDAFVALRPDASVREPHRDRQN
jgi:hypothetical protein